MRTEPKGAPTVPRRDYYGPDTYKGDPYHVGKVQKDHSEIDCWMCGVKGHYSNNCPMAQLAAQRVPEEEETHGGQGTSGDNDVEGSQYKPSVADLDD